MRYKYSICLFLMLLILSSIPAVMSQIKEKKLLILEDRGYYLTGNVYCYSLVKEMLRYDPETRKEIQKINIIETSAYISIVVLTFLILLIYIKSIRKDINDVDRSGGL